MKKKHNIIKYLLILMVSFLLITILNLNVVKADVGPKSYVEIIIKGVDDKKYYVTLLSQEKSTGPFGYYDEETREPYQGENLEIWRKFQDYQDIDNFYFLSFFSGLSGEGKYRWGYHPPRTFKMLIYFPEQDKFIVSKIYQRYAFGSIYTFDLAKIKGANSNINQVNFPVELQQQPYFFRETGKFILRVVLTITIELLIALIVFRPLKKKEFLAFILVNVATQILLNIGISIWSFYFGIGIFDFLVIIILEILIFLIEGTAYTLILKNELKERGRSWWVMYLYSLVANLLSFIIGYFLIFIR